MRKRRQRKLPSPSKPAHHLLETQQAQDTLPPDYEQGLMRLLHLGERLCGQTHDVANRLAQEITQITHSQAQLVLSYRVAAKQSPPDGSTSFPVQFRDFSYGMLSVQNDPAQPTEPAIPPATAYLLARICGSILYALEVSAFLQCQYQHLEAQVHESLTGREQEVLKLVDTHRWHLYEKLHVHQEYELPLAAFRAGLFSPLEAASHV
jgi:DNA-binding NarL/FixJ family response regulator